MILLLASFGPFDTAILPAAGLWTVSSGVTIVAGGGRSGDASDNCAAFSTALGSVLARIVAPTASGGLYTATYGLAVQVLTVTPAVDPDPPNVTTLASIWTTNSHIDLQLLSDGSLRLLQVTGGVPVGTICQTVPDVVPIGSGGSYIEVQIPFETGELCQIRTSNAQQSMNAVAQGSLLGFDPAELPYTTFRLGGGVGEEPATWRATDVYLNDGVPAATPIYQGLPIYNDSFFGNTHIEAYYPTADGTNLTVGNTPWEPSTGVTQYTQIDEHPPDEDVTYDFAEAGGQTSTFVYQSPRSAPFGRRGCAGMAQIYGLQWEGRPRHTGLARIIASIVREIVTGTLAGDQVAQGDPQLVDSESYLYYPEILDRHPLTDDPWSFLIFFPASVGAVGSTEFGIRLL